MEPDAITYGTMISAIYDPDQAYRQILHMMNDMEQMGEERGDYPSPEVTTEG